MIGIGLYFSRKNKSSEQFTTASGKIPRWALGLSFYATFLSAITFLGDPGKSFGGNWNAFVFSLSIPFAALVSTKYFVPFYRNSGEISAYTHLEHRFGPWARTYVMVCFIFSQLARMGTIFYGIALTINAMTDFSMPLIIIVLGLCIIFYTVLGGMEAVIWTEVIQAIIKTLGALLILGIIGSQIGIAEVISEGYENNKFSLGSFKPDLTTSSFWVVLLYGFFINLTNFGIDQNYVQRYHTARSAQDAKNSIWLFIGYFLPVSFLFFFIGTALYVYYGHHPELIEVLKQGVSIEKNIAIKDLNPADYGDRVLPFFMKTQIPTGFLGLLLAALLSAAMSTMSSGMNSSATVFLKDIYLRYNKKVITPKRQLQILHFATVIMGLLGISFGIAMIGVKSLLDVWWKLSGVFAGGMLGIFLLGYLSFGSKKAQSELDRTIKGRYAQIKVRNIHAKIATIFGVFVIAWMSFKESLPPQFQSPFDSKLTVVIGTLTILFVGFGAFLFSPNKK